MICFGINYCTSETENKHQIYLNKKKTSYGLINSSLGVQTKWAGTRKCWTLEYNDEFQPSIVAFQV
jgi:hypothetical protein